MKLNVNQLQQLAEAVYGVGIICHAPSDWVVTTGHDGIQMNFKPSLAGNDWQKAQACDLIVAAYAVNRFKDIQMHITSEDLWATKFSGWDLFDAAVKILLEHQLQKTVDFSQYTKDEKEQCVHCKDGEDPFEHQYETMFDLIRNRRDFE